MTAITQTQITAAVDHFIACALVFENARDKCEFESPKYWDNHDKAINLFQSASALMPGGQGWGWSKLGWTLLKQMLLFS